MTDRTPPPDEAERAELLRAWVAELVAELGLENELAGGAAVDIDAVLGLAGVAAHSIVRPAAPVATYVAGLAAGVAIGRGATAPEALDDALRRARARALGRS